MGGWPLVTPHGLANALRFAQEKCWLPVVGFCVLVDRDPLRLPVVQPDMTRTGNRVLHPQTSRPHVDWGFGIAGKENKVSVACYKRLDQIASDFQQKYELHPVKAGRRDIEARVWSLVHDHPTLAALLSCKGGAYEIATFKPLSGRPNWTMEWTTGDQLARAAFDRIVRSVQTQIELE
jgi:hypothetical protein